MQSGTHSAQKTTGARAVVLDLDVLRGLAAVMMIVNHAGYRLLSNADAAYGVSGAAVFFGSFAPVVFFFSTGFGTGLGVGATGRPPGWWATLWKASLLVLADQIAYWSGGASFGLDFFSFIGIAMVLLCGLARLRHSIAWCLGLSGALLVARYGVGPLAGPLWVDQPPLVWLLGVRGLPGVSYPLSPWMIYPLIGFVLGRLYTASKGTTAHLSARWTAVGAAVCAASFAGAAVLVQAHATMFRWGTVSVAFFVLSCGVLAACGLLATASSVGSTRVAKAFALRGVASFAVIPLHYGLIDVLDGVVRTLQPLEFATACVALVVASWGGSKTLAWILGKKATTDGHRLLFGVLLAVLAVLVSITVIGLPRGFSTWAAATVILAQLVIAALLAFRPPSSPRLPPVG